MKKNNYVAYARHESDDAVRVSWNYEAEYASVDGAKVYKFEVEELYPSFAAMAEDTSLSAGKTVGTRSYYEGLCREAAVYEITENGGEGAIYEFLAGPFEMNPEEVADLDLDILIENCQHLARENNLGAFFKSAAKLMK